MCQTYLLEVIQDDVSTVPSRYTGNVSVGPSGDIRKCQPYLKAVQGNASLLPEGYTGECANLTLK